VEFAANQRHHVKGGFGSDGGYRLIVNRQVSPPTGELSSGCVKDFYLTLSRGDKIEALSGWGRTRQANRVVAAKMASGLEICVPAR